MVYEEKIKPVCEVVRRWLERAIPDRPENVRNEFAKFLATLLVLGAEYGAGDALAGYLLNNTSKDLIGKIHRVLRDVLKVGNLPSSSWMSKAGYAMSLLRAEWPDPEVAEAVKELERMSLSGGSYVPKFMRR